MQFKTINMRCSDDDDCFLFCFVLFPDILNQIIGSLVSLTFLINIYSRFFRELKKKFTGTGMKKEPGGS